MILFPFSNSFAMDRAKFGNQGEFMALYTISFSISHVFAHNAGMQLIDKIGYEMTWNIMTFLSVLCILALWRLNTMTKREVVTE